uniref:Transmembrane protein n=1 Tax=Panagrellus redivivus TaxID=6233 RepID=A0A7E4ZSM2_PANRE
MYWNQFEGRPATIARLPKPPVLHASGVVFALAASIWCRHKGGAPKSNRIERLLTSGPPFRDACKHSSTFLRLNMELPLFLSGLAYFFVRPTVPKHLIAVLFTSVSLCLCILGQQ